MHKNILQMAVGSLGIVVLVVLATGRLVTDTSENPISAEEAPSAVTAAASADAVFVTELNKLVFGMHFKDLNQKELKPVKHVEEPAFVTPDALEQIPSETAQPQPAPQPNSQPTVAQPQPVQEPTQAPVVVPVVASVEGPGAAQVKSITVVPSMSAQDSQPGMYSQEEQMASIQGGCFIMGNTYTYLDQMIRYFNANQVYPEFYQNSDAPTIEAFCQIYMEEAQKEGVRAEVAFCQAMKETGFLRYMGDVRIEQFNFAGIGATGGGVQGDYFADVRTGIRAQIQHLKAYASTEDLQQSCVDPRFQYVNRGTTPYVEWLGIHENPFGGGWAAATNYGNSIIGDYLAKLFAY